MAHTYSYTLIYEGRDGQDHERHYTHDQADQAQAQYEKLPAWRYKALWQSWTDRHPGEQLMKSNSTSYLQERAKRKQKPHKETVS